MIDIGHLNVSISICQNENLFLNVNANCLVSVICIHILQVWLRFLIDRAMQAKIWFFCLDHIFCDFFVKLSVLEWQTAAHCSAHFNFF